MTCDDGSAAVGAAGVALPRGLRDAVCFDCQATGATPAHGHLLEVAWDGRTGWDAVVRLPDGEKVPPRVEALTGISTEDARGGRSADDVRARLRAALWDGLSAACGPQPWASPLPLGSQPRALIVHFASFETKWLQGLLGSEPVQVVCTHEIARRLYPALPSRGLRALAGYLGYDAPELKRAADHVAATRFIWEVLARELVELGVGDVASLLSWIATTPVVRPGSFAYRVPRQRRLAVPDAPGVYRFLGAQGEVLYVGKATSLRRRVNSYFQKRAGRADHKNELVTRAHDLQVTLAGSPLEAALLESDEIKRHDPVCNRALRARGRAPVWSSPDLLEVSPEPDDAHPLGPLPGSWERAGLLAQGCDDAAVLLRVPDRFHPEPEVFRAGHSLFRSRHAEVSCARALLRLGDRLWVDMAKAQEEDDDIVPVRGWSPETVYESLTDIARGAALAVRRAFWFGQLAGASVCWRATHNGARRSLQVAPPDATLPPIAGYDRLRILSTELRRVLAATDEVELRLRSGAVLDAQQLRGALAWV